MEAEENQRRSSHLLVATMEATKTEKCKMTSRIHYKLTIFVCIALFKICVREQHEHL